MTQSYVINKLSIEMAVELEDFDKLWLCRKYIQIALSIGLEHFDKDMDEIIQMSYTGEELGIYKSTIEAEQKTGIDRRRISAVTSGKEHSAGGFIWIKSKDKELVPVKKTA
jgi:hypothetical protein